MTLTQDRLRALIDVLVESVDDPAQGEALAQRAHFSRFHFDRLVRAATGESPAAFRRRLLLERAAYELGHGESVVGAAAQAGYTSGEAFSRAFRRAYGVPPTRHVGDFRLPAPNGVHFHPPGGLLVPADERRHPMDLAERMVAHDNRLAAELIDVAAQLDDAALDEPNRVEPPTDAFHDEEPSIRSMLNRLVFTTCSPGTPTGGTSSSARCTGAASRSHERRSGSTSALREARRGTSRTRTATPTPPRAPQLSPRPTR